MTEAMLEEIQQHIDKAKIVEVLFRYCRGVDRGDRALIKSVFHPDGTDAHSFFKGSGWDFADFICDNIGNFGRTCHMVTNYLVDLDGDFADVESYCVGFDQGARIDDQDIFLLAIGRYLDRFQKRDGEWRILSRQVIYDINQSASVAESWTGPWFGNWAPRGQHHPHDLIYRKA